MQAAQAYSGHLQAGAITIAGVALAAEPAGALWHEEARALVVADLHLEKGSAFAARGPDSRSRVDESTPPFL